MIMMEVTLYKSTLSTILFFLFSFIFTSSNIIGLVNSQDLPQQELNSAIWIIKQYGINVPQNQSLCNYKVNPSDFSPIFRCSSGHVDEILSTSSFMYQYVGNPDPMITSLYFPSLKSISITTFISVTIESLNILNYLNNLPYLTTLKVADNSIKSIPNNFPNGLPRLQSFYCGASVAPSPSLFNNTVIQSFQTTGIISTPMVIDRYLNMTSLTTISIYIGSTATLEFTSHSFPLLTTLSVVGKTGTNVTVTISTIIDIISFSSPILDDPEFHLNLLRSDTLSSLKMVGKQSTINPSNLSNFPNLRYVVINQGLMNGYPFSTWPKNLSSLDMTENNITVLPDIQVPSTVTNLVLSGNKIQSPVPWGVFSDAPQLQLYLRANPSIIEEIPSTLCSIRKLDIYSSGVTKIPDCFWCYQDPYIIVTSLGRPIYVDCTVRINTPDLGAIFGKAQIVGSNLGWGNPNNTYPLSAIIPNKLLEFSIPQPYSNFYSPQPVRLSLSNNNPQFTYDFSVRETGIMFSYTTVTSTQSSYSVVVTLGNVIFNNIIPHTVTLDSTIPCPLTNLAVNTFSCKVNLPLVGNYNLTLINDWYSASTMINIVQKYPVVSSASSDDDSVQGQKIITLGGDFGNNGQTNATVFINNAISCSIRTINNVSLVCNISTSNINIYGPVSVNVMVDGFNFTGNNMLYFVPPSNNNNNTSTTTTTTTTGGNNQPTPKEQCDTNTHNCYGNGECQDNGQCKCDEGYSQLDNCLTKLIDKNVTIETNITSPVTKFNIDGVEFNFEMYAIQELDVVSNTDSESVLKQVMVEQWISNATTDGPLTTVNYKLLSNQTNANVTATISFSSQPRQVTFGSKTFGIDANSIKVTVGIDNWEFLNNIATLRVLFRTTINNEQLVDVGCDEQQNIEAFSYDSFGSTIQYLRVVKGGLQFTGRFLDFILSDGRSTYSTTQLVSLNPLNGSSSESIALIGVNLPQCQQCLLDPDFTPLIIDNDRVSGRCDNDNSKMWKIAVGVSVGGAVFIALLIATIYYLKDSNSFRLRLRNAKSIVMKKL